jgi:hypothetical protein
VGWSISLAVALVVMLYVALPMLLRFGIPHALSRYGVESSVESARVDLMNDEVTLVGFNVGPAGGPGIHWGEVVAQMDIAALLKGKIRVIDFQIKDARLDLRQMDAAQWRRPDRGAETAADGGPWDIELGDVELRDLKLIGLSERLGRPVVVRSLKIGDFSHLETRDRVAFELHGALGEAPLKLTGHVRLQENLPILDGRYELGALELDGLGTVFGLKSAGAIEGRVDGTGKFDLRYEPEQGVVEAVLSGRVGVSELKFTSAFGAVSEGGAVWSGDVRLHWPGHEKRPRVEARGSVTTKHLVAEHSGPGQPVKLEGEGLKWNGTLVYTDALSIEGRLRGEGIRLGSRSAQTGDAWKLEGSRVALDSRHLWKGREVDNQATFVTAEAARISVKRAGSSLSATLSKPALSNLGWGASGFDLERIFIESAQAEVLANAASGEPQRWQVIGLDARNLRAAENGAIGVARLEVQQAQLDLDSTTLRINEALAVAVTGGKGDPWRADEVTVGSLRNRQGDYESWGSEIQVSGVSYSDTGTIRADALRAVTISQSKSGRPQWEMNGAAASGLSANVELAEAERMSVASFVHGGSGADVLEIDDADASGVSIRTSQGAGAASIKLKALRHRSGQIAALELNDANIAELDFTLDGEGVMKSVDVRELRYTDADANVTTVKNASLTTVSGEFAKSVRIEAARADHLSHDRPAGARLRAWTLELSRVGATIEGVVSAGAATIDFVETGSPRGNVFTAGDVTLEGPRWEPPLSLAAKGLRIREGNFNKGTNRWMKVSDIEAGAIGPRADGSHGVVFIRAGGAHARDSVAGSELRTGALELIAVSLSNQGHFQAGSGTLSNIEISDARSEPSGASFSAARIVLEDPAIEPGKLIDLGGVTIEDSNLAFGLSESEGLLLPKAPFVETGEESSSSFAVTRVATKGKNRVVFFDRSTSPPFEIAASPLDVSFGNLHTGDPARRADFRIEGGIDTFSGLKINGQLSVGKEDVNLLARGTLRGYKLKGFNSYMAIDAKESILSGRVDLDFDIALEDRNLSGTADLVFSKVIFESVDSPSTGSVGEAGKRSLASAFNLLKDPNDIVRIQVPISGSLDDPNFDFSDAVSQGTTKAIWSTVRIVFKPLILLSPATALVSSFGQPTFNPVAFEPGDARLSGQGLSYLDTLARELQAHPRVQVKICGRAVPSDLTVIEQHGKPAAIPAGPGDARTQQIALARSRALAVRQYLEANQLVTVSRLLDCEAEIEPTAGSLPRVELMVYLDGRPAPVVPFVGTKGEAD